MRQSTEEWVAQQALARGVELPRISEGELAESIRRLGKWERRLYLPPGWSDVTREMDPGMQKQTRGYSHRDGRKVIVSVGAWYGWSYEWWLHVSISRAKQIPSYWDLADVKAVFVGPDLQAIQVFPPATEHVNIHPYCLHLWACLSSDRGGLPNFGQYGTI